MDTALLSRLPAVDPVIGHAASASIGIVFLLAAFDKLPAPEVFRDAVENYRLLPKALAAPVARALPVLEALAGVALVPVATRAIGAALALVLLAVVTAAVAINVMRGRTRIDCGCGGDHHLPLGRGLLLRNLGLAAVTALAALPASDRATVWIDPIATVFCVLSLLALHALTHALLRNHSRLLDLRNAP